MKRTLIFLLTVLAVSVLAKPSKKASCNSQFERGVKAYQEHKYALAANHLSQVRLNCIGGFEEPDSIYYVLGKAYLGSRKVGEARLEFRVIVDEYPHSRFREESMYLLGYCSYKSAPIIERDSKVLRRAMRELNLFVAEYPSSSFRDSATVYINSIYEKLVEKEFLSAEYYVIVEKYESAVIYYRAIINDFPQSPRVAEAKVELALSLIGAKRFSEATTYLKEFDITGDLPEEVVKARAEMDKAKKKQAKNAQKKR